MKYPKFLTIIMLIAGMLMSGCSAYYPVQLRQERLDKNYIYYSVTPPLYQGDVVQCKYKDGSQDSVTVRKVTPQSLVTSNGRVISLADVVSLEKKDISTGRTTAATGAGIGVTAAVIIAAASVAFAAMAGSI